MAEVIGARADVARIEDHVRRALVAAKAREGEIAATAESRLGPAVAGITSALALKESAEEAESIAWAQVLAEDAKSDNGIGSVRDAMWNAIGRMRQNSYLEQVFPGGVTTYTAGDVRGQPVLMHVLESRISASAAPQWSEQAKQGWAAEIQALRTTYAAALDAHRPLEAALTVADASYRSAVRTAQARLRAFKRDLQNLGMSEAQIHEIIPDASTRTAAAKVNPPPGQ